MQQICLLALQQFNSSKLDVMGAGYNDASPHSFPPLHCNSPIEAPYPFVENIYLYVCADYIVRSMNYLETSTKNYSVSTKIQSTTMF